MVAFDVYGVLYEHIFCFCFTGWYEVYCFENHYIQSKHNKYKIVLFNVAEIVLIIKWAPKSGGNQAPGPNSSKLRKLPTTGKERRRADQLCNNYSLTILLSTVYHKKHKIKISSNKFTYSRLYYLHYFDHICNTYILR